MSQHSSRLAVLSFIVLVCAGCGPGDGFERNQRIYRRVIERVQNGEIKTDEEKGVKIPSGSIRLPCSAQLPSSLLAATVDGEVYVSRPSAAQLIIVFKTWKGKGFNMVGFLYAAKPLSGAEITKDYYGHSVVVIGPMELVLEKQLDPNWYRVSHKLD
jgi:hypothetical protein